MGDGGKEKEAEVVQQLHKVRRAPQHTKCSNILGARYMTTLGSTHVPLSLGPKLSLGGTAGQNWMLGPLRIPGVCCYAVPRLPACVPSCPPHLPCALCRCCAPSCCAV